MAELTLNLELSQEAVDTDDAELQEEIETEMNKKRYISHRIPPEIAGGNQASCSKCGEAVPARNKQSQEAVDREEAEFQEEMRLIRQGGLAARFRKARAALKMVEWHCRPDGKLVCLWCQELQEDGHVEDCARQVALAEKEAS